MEFLYKLYDQEYFGIILFIAITILAFLFLIILFFGKKDEKQRKIEETKQLNLANGVSNDNLETNNELSIPEIQQPIIENKVNEVVPNEEVPAFENPVVLPTVESAVETNNEQPTIEEELTSNIPIINNEVINDSDNASLDATVNPFEISEEEQEIPEETVNNEVEETITNPFDTISDNEETNNIFDEPEKEEVNPFEVTEVKQESSETSPMFELPKMAEESNTNDEKDTVVEDTSSFNNLFGDIEQETYNIKK